MHCSPDRLTSVDVRISENARRARSAANLLWLITRIVTLELRANLLGLDARVGDRRSVTVVGVDAHKGRGATLSKDTIENDVAFEHGLAVAARSVQLAKVGDVESRDGDGTGAIVLDDLVLCALGSASDDLGSAGLLLDGQGVFADGFPPDVLDCAGTHAVNTFGLVGADDDVPKGCALLKLEDGVRITTFGLSAARYSTTKALHSTVKFAGHDHGFRESRLASGFGEGGAGFAASGRNG